MNTYAIIIDEGYGTHRQGQTPRDYIEARTAQAARKEFLRLHNGTWYAKPGLIRATKIA